MPLITNFEFPTGTELDVAQSGDHKTIRMMIRVPTAEEGDAAYIGITEGLRSGKLSITLNASPILKPR